MREILFRGKLTSTGEWTEGNLNVRKNSIAVISPDDTPLGRYGQVIPETVGQYTGSTDKNGIKIFEGDILKATIYAYEHIGRIVYNKSTSGFEFWYNEIVGAYGEKATFKRQLYQSQNIEVIGNVHDNPELLEV